MTESSEIRKLREQVETLQELVRQMEGTLTPDEECSTWAYGLTKTQTAMFERLKQTEMVTRETLMDLIDQINGGQTTRKSLDVMMHYTRKRIKKHGYNIVTIWGVGYRLEYVGGVDG